VVSGQVSYTEWASALIMIRRRSKGAQLSTTPISSRRKTDKGSRGRLASKVRWVEGISERLGGNPFDPGNSAEN